jgi:hypothetical protein
MERFNELLEKRENLTADIAEEQELIDISKTLSEEELKDVNPKLLTFSNGDRLDSISDLLDKLIAAVGNKNPK